MPPLWFAVYIYRFFPVAVKTSPTFPTVPTRLMTSATQAYNAHGSGLSAIFIKSALMTGSPQNGVMVNSNPGLDHLLYMHTDFQSCRASPPSRTVFGKDQRSVERSLLKETLWQGQIDPPHPRLRLMRLGAHVLQRLRHLGLLRQLLQLRRPRVRLRLNAVVQHRSRSAAEYLGAHPVGKAVKCCVVGRDKKAGAVLSDVD